MEIFGDDELILLRKPATQVRKSIRSNRPGPNSCSTYPEWSHILRKVKEFSTRQHSTKIFGIASITILQYNNIHTN